MVVYFADKSALPMALCLVPFASSVLGEHSSSRFAFVLYAVVMALAEILSAVASAYVTRATASLLSPLPESICSGGHEDYFTSVRRHDLPHFSSTGAYAADQERAPL